MHLFYAYGAGLGHLNRVCNFIYSQNITLSNCIILTNSDHIHFIPKPIIVLHKRTTFFKDKVAFSKYLNNCIANYKITTLVVDVFPDGFYGEFGKLFSNLKSIKTILLARILKETYFEEHSCPKYDEILLLEKGIAVENYKYIKLINYTLKIKPRAETKRVEVKTPYFLIIHSFPKEEVLLLYKQALLYRSNENIYIFTYSQLEFVNDELEEKTTIITGKKASDTLLKNAIKIFSGCGFNTLLETEKYRKKQHVIPFKRRFDDQFKRKTLIKN